MSWKTELRCSDLDATMQVEATCKRCGIVTYETRETLLAREELDQATLAKAEKLLKCKTRTCRGPVRLALIYKGRMEGFVGGMA